MKVLFWLGALLLLSYTSNSQTVQEILKKFIDSSGGEKRISKIRSSHFEMISISENDTIFITIDKEKPNKYASVLISHGKRFGMVFNNGKCINLTDSTTNEIKDTSVLEELLVQSNILPEMSYDLNKYKIEKDTAHIGSIIYNVLKIYSPTNRFLSTNYYHPVTGMLDIFADAYGRLCYYMDYRYYKGFNLPRKAILVQPDGVQIHMEVTNIKLDVPTNPVFYNL
jgi:hypothetical protein